MNKQSNHFEVHTPVQQEGESPVSLLAQASGLSKQSIKQAMQNGAVWLSRDGNTRRVRRAKLALAPGDELHFYYDRAIQASRPDAAYLIADEGAYSVWFKPSGMYSQGSRWGDHCTIYRWAETQLQREAFIVHRLDRAASGLILIAHTKTMASQLSRLFEQRLVKKTYRALVMGAFSAPLPASNVSRITNSAEPPVPILLDNDIDGRQARSHVTLLNYDEVRDRSLLQVIIETGRKHQIRRHLSEAGHPIIGDRLYGEEDVGAECGSGGTDKRLNLQLAACYLGFEEPLEGVQKDYFAPDSLLPPSLIDQHS